MILSKDGFDYTFDTESCRNCRGNCCRGESGYVFLTAGEISSISDFLSISAEEFLDRFTLKTGYRVSIAENFIDEEYLCVFFDRFKKKCQIYPVRPAQCRSYPFWEKFRDKSMQSEIRCCPGVKNAV